MIRVPKIVLLALVAVLASSAAVLAEVPRLAALGAPCETELALSALPEHLRQGAAVYGFSDAGYAILRPGTNGFTCIVNRDDPYSLKPTCFDREGTATIIPKILRVADHLLAGKSREEIRADLDQAFESGELISPRRPGIAYMLSHYNRPYDASKSELAWFPPHLMFYAPNLTNEDIGHSHAAMASNRSLPFIGYQGPHGYMIVLAEDPGERQPLSSCPTWLNE